MKTLPAHIQAKIDAYRAKQRESVSIQNSSIENPQIVQTASSNSSEIILNDKQQLAVSMALAGKSFILTGAAGTGKTTTTKAIAEALASQPGIRRIATSTKNLQAGMPGIFFLAFTRAAVRNLMNNLPDCWKSHCFTIHKFVEMVPEEEWRTDSDGNAYAVRVYKPNRNNLNPFPPGIQTLIIDEASMVSETHYKWLTEALFYNVQFIFLGDINQLPTVADYSIFPQKLTSLPVVELTHVYRQALESPIIRLAHRIKNGQAPTHQELLDNPQEYKNGNLVIYRFPKPIMDSDVAILHYVEILKKLYNAKKYDPYNDIILIPWEKKFGWREINRHIANMLDEELRAKNQMTPMYEIISMARKEYFRIGDKVLYDKNPAIIREINPNGMYAGQQPKAPNTSINRWGLIQNSQTTTNVEDDEEFDFHDLSIEMIDQATRQCSHVITIQYENGELEKISTNQEFSLLSLGYSTTVHKAQGGQWDHVIFLIHKSHYISVNRELLYTGITRAKERLTIICEKDTLEIRAKAQAIKGDTVEEKIEWYREKLKSRNLGIVEL